MTTRHHAPFLPPITGQRVGTLDPTVICPRCSAPGRLLGTAPVDGQMRHWCPRCGRIWVEPIITAKSLLLNVDGERE